MKKLFSILSIAMLISFFSGCVIVTTETNPKYNITFYNELPSSNSNDVFDWYAKNRSGNNFVVSSTPTRVSSGSGRSTLRNVPRNDYKVVFTFDDTTDSNNNDIFYESDFFYLNEDKDFILQSRESITGTIRSVGVETVENNSEFQIVDSDGNVYPLHICSEE